jgi:hypothetical protein
MPAVIVHGLDIAARPAAHPRSARPTDMDEEEADAIAYDVADSIMAISALRTQKRSMGFLVASHPAL